MKKAVFETFNSLNKGWAAYFESPTEVYTVYNQKEVIPILRIAEEAVKSGKWAVIILSYEAAPAFDSALCVHSLSSFPLAWVALFDNPSSPKTKVEQGLWHATPWEAKITRDEYVNAVNRIQDYIVNGDTYQTNFTFPLECKFNGDSWAWYRTLCSAQGASFCAYLDLGRFHILSISPELFFLRSGTTLVTRPMKGTMRRGRWSEEDDEMIGQLAVCEKNRAENVMIVDLLRNDLGKVSIFGGVRVKRLFEIERYQTLLQMVSSIEAEVKPGTGIVEIMEALFPCGSVTGAPKASTMRIIRELEAFPRGIYTGAIGYICPGGDCIFNVAIRTIVLDVERGIARFGVGGGITYDSTPMGEYDECMLKARFLNKQKKEFELLETILLESGEYFLLQEHLRRIKSSAKYFGFQFDKESIRFALDQIRREYNCNMWKIRLLLNRNGSFRITPYEFKLETNKLQRVGFSQQPIDPEDPFLFHKTTNRLIYKQTLSARPDCDDIIFWNKAGEITESTIANIILSESGFLWTPPRSSGLLAGTYRNHLLENGIIKERIIYKDELLQKKSFFLINSVQKWIPAVLVD